jgi:hypothetical protein
MIIGRAKRFLTRCEDWWYGAPWQRDSMDEFVWAINKAEAQHRDFIIEHWEAFAPLMDAPPALKRLETRSTRRPRHDDYAAWRRS